MGSKGIGMDNWHDGELRLTRHSGSKIDACMAREGQGELFFKGHNTEGVQWEYWLLQCRIYMAVVKANKEQEVEIEVYTTLNRGGGQNGKSKCTPWN